MTWKAGLIVEVTVSDPQTDAALAELLDDLGIRHELTPLPLTVSERQAAYGEAWEQIIRLATDDLTPYIEQMQADVNRLAFDQWNADNGAVPYRFVAGSDDS